MILKHLKYFLLIVICGSTSFAKTANRCSDLYSLKISEVVTSVESSFLNPKAQGWIQRKQLMQLQALTRKTSLVGISSQSELNNVIDHIFTLLWKLHSANPQFDQRNHLKSEIQFRRSLLRSWQAIVSDRSVPSSFKKELRASFNQGLGLRVTQLILLPWTLPKARLDWYSQDDMLKILTTPLERAEVDLKDHLKKQNIVYLYNELRPYYSIIAPTFAFIVYQWNEIEKKKKYSEEQYQILLNELVDQRAYLEKQLLVLKDQIYEEALEQALRDFEEYWGEPPSLEEKEQLRLLIKSYQTDRAIN